MLEAMAAKASAASSGLDGLVPPEEFPVFFLDESEKNQSQTAMTIPPIRQGMFFY